MSDVEVDIRAEVKPTAMHEAHLRERKLVGDCLECNREARMMTLIADAIAAPPGHEIIRA